MPVSTVPLPSRIALLVHSHFDALPARNKPNVFDDGSREWIPLTGIVAVKGENTPLESLTCLAITSGAKCLSASQIPGCQGLVLHDCHAEILAIRAFNYWLLTECRGMFDSQISNSESKSSITESPFIRRRDMKDQVEKSAIDWPPFEIQPDVKFYMYCTCAPCGDGSMELCMDSQEDATPWEVRREVHINSDIQQDDTLAEGDMLDGRAHFSLLGVVRRKPARMDAESTRSKSCSDKLALRQVSSLLSCQTSRFIAPTSNAYFAGLVLPEDEISHVACERAFGENGRMRDLKGRSWPGQISSEKTQSQTGYQFRPFNILSVAAEEIALLWKFAKPKTGTPQNANLIEESSDSTSQTVLPKKRRPGNVSTVWAAASSYPHVSLLLPGSTQLPTLFRSKTGLYETIINGVKQGNKAFSGGQRGASSLSRARLWNFLRETVDSEGYKKYLKDTQVQNQLVESVPAQELHGFLAKQQISKANSYAELKQAGTDWADPLQVREEVLRDAKKVLKGWVPNTGDEGWDLTVLNSTTSSSKKRKIGL
ncbi:hypothetical protein N7495_005857 [Penicillium taxi]|uniref:uncharacterized protein n=1 Tax=Penicillium taxi TaxID=168475 RepID=UPI0025458D74|nr:uncharacterized protein N7495_005857 [Penicillium taxi]KAJ5894166.1 hypothetical protein N7495_005857 [Penicillium taxi]